MRRSHRKSRHGCKECKQRHAKCDESRPVCGSCASAKRHCSYLNAGPMLPPLPLPSPSPTLSSQQSLSVGPSPVSQRSPSAQLTLLDSITSQSPTGPDIELQHCPSHYASEHCYSTLHLELLHHLEHGFSQAMGLDQPDLSKTLEMAVQEAFTTPFLMDELLAVSAAHRSTLTDQISQPKSVYCTEATHLQTRALARYSASAAHKGPSLAVFLFSTFLGLHVLFDTFSQLDTGAGHNLAAFLDRLVQCLGIHRGIAAVAGHSWPAIMAELRARLGPDAELFNANLNPGVTPGTECADLLTRLADENGDSELSKTSREACHEAVAALQRAFDAQRVAEGRGRQVPEYQQFIGVQEWLVRVSGDYINLLARRQPEALVILAYYSVMLHRVRGHWIVQDVGKSLVRSISSHLGGYWAAWLEWPNHMVDVMA